MKLFRNSLLITFSAIIFSCSAAKEQLIKTNNQGGYKVKVLDNELESKTEKLKIFGQVVDLETKEPLINSQLIIGCEKIVTSSEGKYAIDISKLGPQFFIEISSIGYKKIITDFFDVQKPSAIQINFFLEEDDRPLINCEDVF